MEGSLAKAQAEIARLNSELLTKSESFEQEKKNFDVKFGAEVEKSSNLQKSLKECRRFETGGSLGPTSECRRVPQPRWVERVGEREGVKERGGWRPA
jgi:hypothetical protein